MFRLLLLILIVSVSTAVVWLQTGEAWTPGPSPGATAASTAAAPVRGQAVIAAPGVVEPVSEEIDVAAEVGGKLKSVRVRAGDSVAGDDIVAELENDGQKARVALARAQVQQKEAALRRLLNGARPEEKREAYARVTQAEAVVRNAKAELERRTALAGRGFASAEETQRLERVYEVAKADLEAAQQHYALITSPPREEDVDGARAEVALAEAQLAEAEASLKTTIIRAPLSGKVLRVHKKVGETVSDLRDTPILTMGDVSTLRVRAEVDETDVAKVRVGQRAYVRADAFGQERFPGTVIEIRPSLSRKRIRTDEAQERFDVKVLEVLIRLKDSDKLIPGLRVDVFITPETGSSS